MKQFQLCPSSVSPTPLVANSSWHNRVASKRLSWSAIIVLFSGASAISAEGPSTPLQNFRSFVNGAVPVKEAVVYRQISQTNKVLNEEWWRFGYQPNTWYVQRLHPATNDPAKLVPLEYDAVVGASFTNMWTVADKGLDLVEKRFAVGSRPASYGEFQRSLMLSALSLGLPRRFDAFDIADAQIEWSGTAFRTEINGSNKTNRLTLEGRLTVAGDGSPISAEFQAIGTRPAGTVAYEYRTNGMPVPAICTLRSGERKYRYEFLSLKLGTNDLSGTGGYVPSMFADMKLARNTTVWTNSLPYSANDGKIIPAFRPSAPKIGEPPPELHGSVWFNTAHPLTLRELKGKVILLDFWGTWCPPCVEGLPHVQAQHTKFRNRGLVVIGIHTGWGTEKKLDTFLKDRNITFPVVGRASNLPQVVSPEPFHVEGCHNRGIIVALHRLASKLRAMVSQFCLVPDS